MSQSDLTSILREDDDPAELVFIAELMRETPELPKDPPAAAVARVLDEAKRVARAHDSPFFEKLLRVLRPPSRRIALAASAVGLVAAVSAVRIGEPSGEHGLVAKGAGIEEKKNVGISLAITRLGVRSRVHDGQQLAPGDQIGVFYDADTASHLAAFHLDDTLQISRIFPGTGELSVKIPAGREQPLPDAILIEEGSGCQWIVAVFSDTAHRLDELEREIRARAAQNAGCRLKLDLPEELFVRSVSLRR